MTVAPEVTTTDDDVNPPQPSAATTCQVGKISAKSAALVAAVAVIWLLVLTIITLV
jgi:hypothetical protein